MLENVPGNSNRNFLETSEPKDIETLDKTSTTMTIGWNPPIANKECVHHYRVCYLLLPSDQVVEKNDEVCAQTPPVLDFDEPLEYNLTDLEPCAKYRISVTAITGGGIESDTVFHEDSAELEGMLAIRYLLVT